MVVSLLGITCIRGVFVFCCLANIRFHVWCCLVLLLYVNLHWFNVFRAHVRMLLRHPRFHMPWRSANAAVACAGPARIGLQHPFTDTALPLTPAHPMHRP